MGAKSRQPTCGRRAKYLRCGRRCFPTTQCGATLPSARGLRSATCSSSQITGNREIGMADNFMGILWFLAIVMWLTILLGALFYIGVGLFVLVIATIKKIGGGLKWLSSQWP